MTVWTRIKLAFAAFFTILFKGRLPAALQPAAHAEAPAQPIAADTSDRAVQMLVFEGAPIAANNRARGGRVNTEK
jgi:hypothetical protein